MKPDPKAVILLRGLGREVAHWNGFDNLLQKKMNGLPIIPVDLPGAGDQNSAEVPWTMRGITRDVRTRALQKSPGPFVIVAMSLGGMIAYEWWRVFPEDVTHLILINTSFGSFSPFYRRLRPSVWPGFWKSSVEKDLAKREAIMLEFLSHKPERFLDWSKAFGKVQSERPVKLTSIIRQILAAALYHPMGEKPSAKTLILASSRDDLCNPLCSMDIASRWGVKIEVHPTAGHDLTLDEPEWVAEAVNHFVNS